MNSYLSLVKDVENVTFIENDDLKSRSTAHVGGTAILSAFPRNANSLCKLIEKLKKGNIKHCVIGNGSNVIFPDGIYDGVVIFSKKMKEVVFDGDFVTADCGVNLIYLSAICAQRGLSGLEFSCGIPASVGGAVYMNAGAHGGCISDVFENGKFYLPDGRIETLDNSEMTFSFRKSRATAEKFIVLSATFKLKKDEISNINSRIEKIKKVRAESQPIEFPSAGSVFLPSGDMPAWKLIDGAGLRGYSVGGAMVSDKHAGFIINTGGATASDYLTLTELIKEKVKNIYGVDLQTEIIFIK